MKISYAITVCTEHKELNKLLTFLFENKRPEDEVVVQYDKDNSTQEVWDVIEKFEKKQASEYVTTAFSLNKNFAEYKNNLNKNCKGDWIFQIDADEVPSEYLMKALPYILEANAEVEAYWVPRANEVHGITEEHITKWGWKMDEAGRINWPDWQMRIFRNKDEIYWIKPVHEQLKGYTKFANLPPDISYALHHPKNIGRQEQQNAFYDTI